MKINLEFIVKDIDASILLITFEQKNKIFFDSSWSHYWNIYDSCEFYSW